MANGKPNSICCRSAATDSGIENQLDIVRATFADGTNVPRTPPMRLGGRVYWRDPPVMMGLREGQGLRGNKS